MAVIHIDGFERFDPYADAVERPNLTFNDGAGDWSRACASVSGAGYARWVLQKGTQTVTGRTYYVHFNLKSTALGGTSQFRLLNSDGNYFLLFGTNGSGYAVVRDATGATVATATTRPVLTNQWNAWEIRVAPADAGSVWVRLNGEEIITNASGDFVRDANATFAGLGQDSGDVAGSNRTDDICVCDDQGSTNNTWWNPVAVVGLRPNGEGDTTQLLNGLNSDSFDTTVTASPAPIAWWKMDEAAGTSLADSSGNGYTATLSNGTVAIDNVEPWPEATRANDRRVGVQGSSSNYVDYPVTPFNFSASTTEKSIMYWVKHVEPWGNTNYAEVCIWGYNTGDADPYMVISDALWQAQFQIRMNDNDGGNALDYVADNIYTPGDYFASEEAQSRPVCVVWTFDANKVVKCYVNGIYAGETTHSFTTGVTFDKVRTGPDPTGNGSATRDRFNGDIDEVIVWDSVLTPQRILALYQKRWEHWQGMDDAYHDAVNYSGTIVYYDPDRRYMSETTTNDLDLYTLDDVAPGDLTLAQAMAVSVLARRDYPGAANGTTVIKSDGTTTAGSDFGLTTTWKWLSSLYDTEPGGAAWSQAKLNALQAGFKVR